VTGPADLAELEFSLPTGLPFDDIRALVASMPPAQHESAEAAAARNADLLKPPGALGRLEDIALWMAAWQGKGQPTCDRPIVAIFGADHGVTRRNISPYPMEVTRQMLDSFAAGGAAINQICASYDLGLKVFDLAIGKPTGDISTEPAMSEEETVATIAFGMEAIAGGADLIAVGEMGIGNTTIAAAIYTALYGGPASRWVGRGTAADEVMVARKAAVIEQAMITHKGHLSDPLEILRRLGGREIAAMMGAILAARLQHIPVVLDGFVSTAAAAILKALADHGLDHCVAGHVSAEQAHRAVLDKLGLKPVLSLGMRLGEGSGAAMAMGVIRAAIACHRGMATFSQAGVSGKSAD
jgi:nicotinate-nucleotide--dimethylbenzimidazole phosphoribosyltransferase